MKKEKCSKLVPRWIISHLKLYNNCACGYDIVKKLGKDRLLELIRETGFDCSLRVVPDPAIRCKRKLKYPPSAYYILEVEKVLSKSIE